MASHSNWGILEIEKSYDATILDVSNVVVNTLRFIKMDFDVLFMHNTSPIRLLPIQIIRLLFPSTKRKRVVTLCHASIFGKGHKISRWKILGGPLSFAMNGYDKILFFSPKSMDESVAAGVHKEKCQLVHWGADVNYIGNYLREHPQITQHYWLSTGKENRDFSTMQAATSMMEEGKIRIIKGGVPYLETLRLTAQCKGVLVIPTLLGLNYCTGLTCIVEALALGKPIVSVRNPYFPFDIEKEGCGLYVSPEAPAEIVAAIQKIEADAVLFDAMCSNSKRLVAIYNMATYVKELNSVFHESLLTK